MIQTTTNKDIYLGDGTTRRFEVSFDYETKNNVKQIDLFTCTYTTEEGATKYNNDVTKITSNYDFEVIDNVTYVVYPSDAAVSDGASPMTTGTAIIIMRNTPQEQLSTGQYTSDKVEKQLDKLTMISQDIQEQVNRCYKRPAYSEQVNDIDIDPTGSIEQIYEAAHDAQVAAENASTSAENASSFSTSASLYATNASKWAEGNDSDVTPLGGTHSSKNWASEAANSATSAAASVAACETALSKINLPLLSFRWYDHLLNDQRWLRADTFSWQSGETYSSAYQHLVDDIGYVRYMIPNDDIQEKFYRSPSDDTTMFAWTNQYSTLYTENEFPEHGDDFYYHGQVFGTVLSTGTEAGSGAVTPTTETIAGTTITYYPATDGHKIVLADQEYNVSTIYTATGVAWYYILDTTNTRFKLPRINPNKKEQLLRLYAKGNGKTLGLTDGTNNAGIGGFSAYSFNNTSIAPRLADYDKNTGSSVGADTGLNSSKTFGVTTDQTKSGIITDIDDADTIFSGNKYLYFYVGQFTQSATEQTAGLNAELFNSKVNLDGNNATFAHIIATYSNGTNWYRIWSDAWCEQGGYELNNQGGDYSQTITLLKPFSNTNYNVLLTGTDNNHSNDNGSWNCINKTTTNFTVFNSSDNANNIYWYACGYVY